MQCGVEESVYLTYFLYICAAGLIVVPHPFHYIYPKNSSSELAVVVMFSCAGTERQNN